MTATLRTFLIFTLLILLGTSEAWSCSCLRVGILEGQKESDVVFKGTVTNITEYQISEPYYPGSESAHKYVMYEFEFEIHAIFKGRKKYKSPENLKIRTTGGGADYGNWFEKGTTYLVYSYSTDELPRSGTKTGQHLTTSLCTRTKKTNFFSFFEKLVLTIF